MKSLYCTLLGVGLVAMLAGPAAAQGQGRGRGFGGMGGNLAVLAANPSVQKELKLDDQQVEKARELGQSTGEKMRENFQATQDLEGQERMTKMRELNQELSKSSAKAVAEFLKPEQLTRLKQISYQQQGLMAFNDPDVAKKLNLTDTQKEEIQTIARESMQGGGRGAFNKDASPEERKEAMQKAAARRKAALEKAVAKLNDEQQKTWKELLGTPFEIQFERRQNNN